MPRRLAALAFASALLSGLVGCAAKTPSPQAVSTSSAEKSPSMNAMTIDLDQHPNHRFRIDSFFVPDTARAEFDAAMKRNLAFIEKQPGYRGHLVFEKAGGPSGPSMLNVVTIAGWESQEAFENASKAVRAYYQEIGFDMQATLARWGVRAEIGNYRGVRAR